MTEREQELTDFTLEELEEKARLVMYLALNKIQRFINKLNH